MQVIVIPNSQHLAPLVVHALSCFPLVLLVRPVIDELVVNPLECMLTPTSEKSWFQWESLTHSHSSHFLGFNGFKMVKKIFLGRIKQQFFTTYQFFFFQYSTEVSDVFE